MKKRDCAGRDTKRAKGFLDRLWAYGLILALCLVGGRALASSLTVGTGYINAGGAKDIYAMPDFSSSILSSLATGEPCEILYIQEGWLEIAYYVSSLGRQTGWITSGNIEKAPADYPDELPTDPVLKPFMVPGPKPTVPPASQSSKDYGTATVSTTNGLRLHMRLLPRETSDSMGLYYNGVKVVCHSDPSAEWVTVSVEGYRGYMKSQYLYRGNNPGSVASDTPTGVVVNPKSTGWLNLRNEPTMAGKVIGRFYNGDKVTVLGGTEEWYHVKSGNLAGFVMAQYLQINGIQPGQPGNDLVDMTQTQSTTDYSASLRLLEMPENLFNILVTVQYQPTAAHKVDHFNAVISNEVVAVLTADTNSENHVGMSSAYKATFSYNDEIVNIYVVPILDNGEEMAGNLIQITVNSTGDSWDMGNGTLNGTGYVLCESLSVRDSVSSTAAVIRKLGYGTTVRVLQESGARYNIEYNGIHGWVDSNYVLLNPKYYTTGKQTPAYAYASSNARCVGLIDPGVKLAIIAEMDGYYVVSLRGASAFIKK